MKYFFILLLFFLVGCTSSSVLSLSGEYSGVIPTWGRSAETVNLSVADISSGNYRFIIHIDDNTLYNQFYIWNEQEKKWTSFFFDESRANKYVSIGTFFLDLNNKQINDFSRNSELAIAIYSCSTRPKNTCSDLRWQFIIFNINESVSVDTSFNQISSSTISGQFNITSPTDAMGYVPNNVCFSRGSTRSFGQIRVTSDGRCFETISGEPFYPIVDTAWVLGRLSNQDIEHYIRTRSEQGFNVIKFDPREGDFAKHDFIFATLRKYNIRAEPGLTAGRDHQRSVQYFNRYKNSQKDIIFTWVVGGLDQNHASSAEVTNLINILRSETSSIVSAHPHSGRSLISSHRLNPNILSYYYVHHCSPSDIKALVAEEFRRSPRKPVYLGEPVYEGRANVCGCNNGCTYQQVRRHIEDSINGGVAGISYGHHSIWSFNYWNAQNVGIVPWKTALNSEGAVFISALSALLHGTPPKYNFSQITSQVSTNILPSGNICVDDGKAGVCTGTNRGIHTTTCCDCSTGQLYSVQYRLFRDPVCRGECTASPIAGSCSNHRACGSSSLCPTE